MYKIQFKMNEESYFKNKMAEVEAKHTLHSGIFHPVLRQWQSPNVEITVNTLMYPIFIS